MRRLGTDHLDVLLLGYYPRRPAQRIIEKALELKAAGLVRYLGISGHRRQLFAELAGEGLFDVFHARYSAAHRGAEEIPPAEADAEVVLLVAVDRTREEEHAL